jgi:dolichol-phosphate mannosyltransferase
VRSDKAPEISVVAPVFNESDGISRFVEEACRALDRLGRRYELLCVDDGSVDDTRTKLLALASRFPRLRPLALDAHRGQSAAMAAGVAASRGLFISLIDADLQNDPADLAMMLERLETDDRPCDCVVGVRRARRDPWLRLISSRVANWTARLILADDVTDAGCGLKICRAALLRRVGFFRGAHRFLATLIRMEGGRVVEVAVEHRQRVHGTSKYGYGLGRTFTALRDALGVRWLKDRKLSGGWRQISGPR